MQMVPQKTCISSIHFMTLNEAKSLITGIIQTFGTQQIYPLSNKTEKQFPFKLKTSNFIIKVNFMRKLFRGIFQSHISLMGKKSIRKNLPAKADSSICK